MDTKWKKWKNKCNIALFVVGLSLFVTGTSQFLCRISYQGDLEDLLEVQDSDYQNTKKFRDFISSRMECFLAMACGDFVYGGNVYEYYDASYEDALAEQGGSYSYETAEAIQQDTLEIDDGTAANASVQDVSESEKKASVQNFYAYIKEDKNLLFRIKMGEKLLYSNMDGIAWDENGKNLPDNYNYFMRFDGEKVTAIKDGKTVDIYGDGFYRLGEDYALPGFRNYSVLDKWKQVDIVMLVAKTPVYYRNSSMEDYTVCNDLYYLYQEIVSKRAKLFSSIASVVVGVLLLLVYVFLRENVSAGKRIAALTGKIWFEWKILLFFIVPALYCIIRVESRYGGLFGEAVYFGATFQEYITERYWYFREEILSRPFCVLLLFWCLYLLLNDLLRNRDGYRHGMIGKIAKERNAKAFRLPIAKKIVKRFEGILICIMLQTFCLAAMIVYLIWRMEYSYSYSMGAGGWIFVLAAVLLQGLLIAYAYWYAKKNKMLALDLDHLSVQIGAIRSGDYRARAKFSAEDGDICQMAKDLEDVRKGMELAVEERMKSERMKVELVANVSHDIKTPLTSIISYVKLLGQEKDLPEHVADYIKILDEKSERLKTMVQDVFSVSKAVSGQLDVSFEKLDFGKLICQTLADMEEQIANAPVTVKTELPKTPVMVNADGDRLYRVFQNLIANAVRYSLEGTRIYIVLEKKEAFATACMKNISSRELDPKMDFSERFVRGDESRTDGGSGLGLSIAKSFTEACGGTFRVEVNADLFIVTVSFPIA